MYVSFKCFYIQCCANVNINPFSSLQFRCFFFFLHNWSGWAFLITMLNRRSSESKHLCLLIQEWKGAQTSPGSLLSILSVLLSYFLRLVYWVLLLWKGIKSWQIHFSCKLRWSHGFILYSVRVVYYVNGFHGLTHPDIPGTYSTWSWCIIFLMCYWI